MNLNKMKWIGALFPALFVGLFEFVRHYFLDMISMDSGNLMVAGLTGILFFLYFRGIIAWLQILSHKLQQEKEEVVILKERDRIAHELHDSISQALFFMNIKAMEIETALRQERQPLAEVKELQEAIKFTDTDIRRHIFDLQKVRQETIDLVATTREIVHDFERQSGIKVDLDFGGDLDSQLFSKEKTHLISILQEALCNIRKHARADQVQVNLQENGGHYTLTVKDNGQGFDLTNLQTKKHPLD